MGEGWAQYGSALMSERRWGEAVGALETAIQRKAHWAHLHFMLGKAHAGQGKMALAIEAFREAVHIAPNFVEALFHLGIVLRAQNNLSEAVDPLRQAAAGGSRGAQGLLASMYANGTGIDRNVPLAMLWWARSSRGAIPDTISRTANNHLSQLRRRLHGKQFTPTEQQDVLTGFGLIRQDLLTQAPFPLGGEARSRNTAFWNRGVPQKILLQWMIERGLALEAAAQQTLREWYENGVVGRFPPHHALLERYWVQVAKEGDPMGCVLIEIAIAKDKFPVVRQACLSLRQ